MSKPGKPTKAMTPPTSPPRNQTDAAHTVQWFETHTLVTDLEYEQWTKPLPPYPALSKDDNLKQEEWFAHMLNSQNANRLIIHVEEINNRDKWRGRKALLALELAEQEGKIDELRTVIVDALAATHGKEYAERAAAAIKALPNGRHKDVGYKNLVEEGAVLGGQIEQLLAQLQRHYRTRPTKNGIQWSSTEFAVRYMRNVRKRDLGRNDSLLRQKIDIRRRKQAVDADPTRS